MSDEFLAAAAAALGAPEELVMRSAQARAAADGTSVDEILAAWAGGRAPTAPPPPSDVEPQAPEEPTPEAAPEPEPSPAVAPEPPTPAPATVPPPAARVTSITRQVSIADLPAPVLEGRRDSHARLLLGIAALFLAGLLGTVVLPAVAVDDSTAARPIRSLEAEAGRNVYVREGCWYCHTQLVRPIVTDVGLGPITRPADLGSELPLTVGVARIGPDLTHAGSRPPADDAEVMERFLRDPEGAFTVHQSYRYLSGSDLTDLVAYLASLK
jgi:hypothetical protein